MALPSDLSGRLRHWKAAAAVGCLSDASLSALTPLSEPVGSGRTPCAVFHAGTPKPSMGFHFARSLKCNVVSPSRRSPPPSRSRAFRPCRPMPSPGHHQGRHPAQPVGHHGHLRDRAQGHGADGHRRDQRQGRRAGQEARARGRRPGLQLAAVRRKDQAAADAGQGRRDLRLLDLGVAQVGAAGRGGTQRPAVLPRAVRGRRAVQERVLHRRGAQPAGHSRRGLPDEQGRRRRQALGAAGHRLRVPPHHQQDPARLPQEQGREGHRHRREVHAVRPQRLPDHRRRHQEVLGRRQDRGGLHHQRRLQRAVLQGTGQRRPEGQGRAGRRLLGGRGRAARRGHQAAGGPPGRLELLPVDQEPDQRPSSPRSGPPTPRPRTFPATRTSR